MKLMPAVLIAVVPLLLLLGSAGAAPDEKTVRWIEEVLLGNEFKRRPNRSMLWTSSPTLSIMGANSDQEALVKDTVAHLNETLAHTGIKSVRYVGQNVPDAKITMYFAPIEGFPKIARRHWFKYVDGNWGFFNIRYGLRYRAYRAVILIASQAEGYYVQGDLLQHLILEELTQCLGPRNDSEIFPDSMFYSKFHPKDNPTTLDALDQKLLRFLYNHVPPGTKPEELRTAIENHWDSA